MTAFWASLPSWGRFILILAVLAIGYAFWMTARYNAVKKKVLAMQEALKNLEAAKKRRKSRETCGNR